MADVEVTDTGRVARPAPPKWLGAISGVGVVFVFTLAHNLFIADIWFNVGPMLIAGSICGLCVVWSYRESVVHHSTVKWFVYASFLAAEMIVLGAVSLLLLRPRFAMAELIVADDAFEQLLPPSMPLMIGAMVVGTVVIWLSWGRRRRALAPIVVTQVLLVFLLGHQFAFLGLVESSTALLVVFAEFAGLVLGLAALFCLVVMWSTMLLDRYQSST